MRKFTKSLLCFSVTTALLACAFASSAIAAEKVRTNLPPSSSPRGVTPDGTITAANVGGASIAGNTCSARICEKGGRSWDCKSGLFAVTVWIPWQKKHCPILITIDADRSRQPAYRHR